jgi:hypothetical protein
MTVALTGEYQGRRRMTLTYSALNHAGRILWLVTGRDKAPMLPRVANFRVFSRHSTAVELCLFDWVDDARPARLIALDPRAHRTCHYWQVSIRGIVPGQLYALLWDRLLLPVIINAYWGYLEFELPPPSAAYEPWRRCIDTFLAPPEDTCPLDDGPIVPLPTYLARPRLHVILFAKTPTNAAHPTLAGGNQP